MAAFLLLIVLAIAEHSEYKHDNHYNERQHFEVGHNDHLLGKEGKSQAPSVYFLPKVEGPYWKYNRWRFVRQLPIG